MVWDLCVGVIVGCGEEIQVDDGWWGEVLMIGVFIRDKVWGI